MACFGRTPRSDEVLVRAEDGPELGIVFQHDDRDCVNPGMHWYAISYATGRQVGGAFDDQAGAIAALTPAGGA